MNIIIVKFNQPELERACIESVKKHTDLDKHTLTIYDNYQRKENLAVLWNELIEDSEDEVICLLNNDTLVEEGWTQMAEVLDDPTVGAVGPVTNKCGTAQKGMPKNGKVEEINDLSGFCYLFRKKTWRKVGKFPEDMPFYGQESIFNRKLQDHGFKLVVDRRVFVHHEKGASFKKEGNPAELELGAFHYRNYIKRLKELREIIPQGTRVVFLGAGYGNPFPTFRGIDQTISDFFGTNAVHLSMDTDSETILSFDPDIMIVVNTTHKPEWYEEIRKVKRAGVKTALYWMDLRSPNRSNFCTTFSHTLEKHFDRIFYCAKGWVPEWEEWCKVKTIWMPQATLQHPIPPKGESHEVLHIGDISMPRYHQNRIAVFNQLRDSGIQITQMNQSGRDQRIELSKKSYGLYGSAKFSLSVSPIVEGYTSDRTYHIMGAGGCLIIINPGGMEHLKDYGIWVRSADEIIKAIKNTPQEKVDEIKEKAFKYIQSNHLYKDRYISIIKELCE